MFSETILYIGLAQSLFAAFVLATKKRVETSDKILIACLLTIALKFVLFSFYQQHSEFFDLQFSMGLVPLTFGAYLYLYTVYLVDRNPNFNYMDLLHSLPFFLLTGLYFTFFKDVVDFTDIQYFNNDRFLWVRVLFGLVVFTSIVSYMVLTFIKLRQYRRKLSEQFSYSNRQQRLIWLNFIFVLFGSLFLSYFVTGGINAFTYKKLIDTAALSHVGLTLIAFSVSYFGLRQPSLRRRVLKEDISDTTESSEDTNKKQKPKFTDEEARALIVKLNTYTEEEKPYLNPELTLSDLASQVNLTKNELTDLLNNHIGKNFFSYVNSFRIDAVIKRFENPDFSHYTIIAIAYECGFNSKSTFNSIFKQHTGQTPSVYKKEMLS